MAVSSASPAAAESDDDMPPALHRSAATPSPRRRRRRPTLHRTATHLSCVVETGPEENRVIVIGGFVDDQRLYMLRVPPTRGQHRWWGWQTIPPEVIGSRTNMVYGATLTALPAMGADGACIARAVRFGGFGGGGAAGVAPDDQVPKGKRGRLAGHRLVREDPDRGGGRPARVPRGHCRPGEVPSRRRGCVRDDRVHDRGVGGMDLDVP